MRVSSSDSFRVTAHATSHDWGRRVYFDASEALERLSPRLIAMLVGDQWRAYGELARTILQLLEDRNPEISEFLDYCELRPLDPIPYHCKLDANEAERWLRERRPTLARELRG